jgi:hypothetical protein
MIRNLSHKYLKEEPMNPEDLIYKEHTWLGFRAEKQLSASLTTHRTHSAMAILISGNWPDIRRTGNGEIESTSSLVYHLARE